MKLVYRQIAGAVVATVGLVACTQTPLAPMIAVLPGPNKTFDAFGVDQATCQQYAAAQTAPSVSAANSQAFGAGLFTTALGAAIGGAVGGGRAAGIGAGSGAALGALGAASTSGYAQQGIQQQYDIMYAQCMAAHGNSVPVFSPPPGRPPYSGGPAPLPPRPPAGGPPYYPGAPVPPPPSY